jgi:hypothetical protein
MNGLKLTVAAQVAGEITAAADLLAVTGQLAKVYATKFNFGAGAGQANLVFADQRTLAASASEELDLDGGALLDPFGVALAFKRVKALVVCAAAGNTNKVIVGGAAANAFVGPFGAANNTLAVDPGGSVLIASPTAAGWLVTAGTGDLLKIANGGAGSAVDYDIILIGAAT